MDLATVRLLVRSHEDLEAIDLPDVLIDQWASEAYMKVTRLVKDWPHFEQSESFTTVISQNNYTLSSVELDRIEHVEGPYGTLEPVPHIQEAEERWYNYGTPLTGQGEGWSTWGNELLIYPYPSTAYTVTVRGYREPVAWPGAAASSEPDLPADFHTAILNFTLYRALLQQDDTERAEIELDNFNTLIDELTRYEKQASAAMPFQLGGTENPRRRGVALEWNV